VREDGNHERENGEDEYREADKDGEDSGPE